MVETRRRKREGDLQGLMRRVALGGGHAGVDVGFRVVRETRFSKKFVLPCSEIMSIKSNGLVMLYTLSLSRDMRRRSVTNSIYWHINVAFIPMSP